MDRYQFQWRGRAKVVAIVDMIFTSMSLLGVFMTALLTGVATAEVSGGLQNLRIDPKTGEPIVIPDETKATLEAVMVIVWIAVGLMALVTIVELWAAIRLLHGTEMGREPRDAHRLCAFFRNLCVVVAILEVLGYGFSGYYILMVVDLLIRLIYLYVVFNFMQELEVAQAVPESFGVTIKV